MSMHVPVWCLCKYVVCGCVEVAACTIFGHHHVAMRECGLGCRQRICFDLLESRSWQASLRTSDMNDCTTTPALLAQPRMSCKSSLSTNTLMSLSQSGVLDKSKTFAKIDKKFVLQPFHDSFRALARARTIVSHIVSPSLSPSTPR